MCEREIKRMRGRVRKRLNKADCTLASVETLRLRIQIKKSNEEDQNISHTKY